MPTSVNDLENEFGLTFNTHCDWCKTIEKGNVNGIYLITLPFSIKSATISEEYVTNWIRSVGDFTYDGKTIVDYPSIMEFSKDVINFLDSYLLSGEDILYIGKAKKGENTKKGTSIKTRVKRYYKYVLGSNMRHKGGRWIKTLTNWRKMNVYWVENDNAEELEKELILRFMTGNSLNYPPFANIEYWNRIRNGSWSNKKLKLNKIKNDINN